MSSNSRVSQNQVQETEPFKAAKGDIELWNRFEQINQTLSKHIDHLKEYRLIFSNYQNQILESTNRSATSISDKVCKLVEETIQQDVYNKIENQWRSRIQSSHEKCFQEIVQNLQKTFAQIEDFTNQNNPYTQLNILSIRGLLDNQLAQYNRQLRNVNEDELIQLQVKIDEHFKKYVQFAQKMESNQADPASVNMLPRSEQFSQNNLQDKQSNNNQALNNEGNLNTSTQGLSTNDVDEDVSISKKSDKKDKDSKNNDQNQSGLLSKIKNIFKKDENRPSQVNLEGVSNDFRYCPIKKQWIFEGQEENSVLDEPPPIIPVAGNNQQDNAQSLGGAADSSMSNIGSGIQTPNQQQDAKSSLIRPANYRNQRDMKNKAKEKAKPRPAAVNFMQVQKAEESISNFDSTTNNFDGTQQNLQGVIDSNNLLPSEMNLGFTSAFGMNAEFQQINISDIIERLNSQIVLIIQECSNEAIESVPNIDFAEIEARFSERTQQNGQNICKELQTEIMKLKKENAQRFRSMQIQYENQIKQLTRDYMDLMDESFAKDKSLCSNLHEDETLNSTIDSSVMEFCNKQSEKIKLLQADLLKKQCLMGKQDNKNMEIIKNMVEKITQLETKLLRCADLEIENENLQKINQQLQKLSKDSQEKAAKAFGIKHKNMQSITTINQQLAEQISSRQLLIDTLHQEITQKNRAIHELQAKNTNLQNISYEKEERINELQNTLEDKELELNDLIQKESLLNEDILRLKDALVAIQDELIAKKQEISHHINDITCLQEKNENYEQIEQNMNEELISLQLEFNNFREENDQKIQSLNQEIEMINQKKADLQMQLDQVINEKECLTQEKEALNQEREILIQDKEVLNQEKENLNQEITNLEESIESQKIAFEKEISVFEELITQLVENGQQTGEEHPDIKQPKLIQLLTLLNKKMKEVQSQKEYMEQELKYLNQDIENEKVTVEQLQQECDSLAEQKELLSQDFENLGNEKQQIQEQLEEKTRQIAEISQKLKEEQQKENQNQHYEDLIREKESIIVELEKQLEAINQESQKINEELREKEQIFSQKEETIKILKESVENFQLKYNTKVSELQEIHEMISQLQNDIKQKDIQLEEVTQLNEQLSIQYQDLNMQHDTLIFQNQTNFAQVELLSQQITEQNQLIDDLNQEKNTLSHTLFSNQDLIESYKLKLEELQEVCEFKNNTIADYEKKITELNQTVSQLDLLCQQNENEIQNYKIIEEKLANNTFIDREEYEKKEKELKDKIECLSKEIYDLNRQNDEQTNEFANKMIILESLNTDLNDQMEQIRTDKDRQIQLVKDKYLQLESEYRGQIEDLQSQLKWEKQMNEDSDIHSNKRIDDNSEFNDNSEGNTRSSNLTHQQNLDSKQELDSYKEKIGILEVQIIKLKNELQTSNNTNTVIERQIKSLHQQNENLAKEIDSLLIKLENETKKSIALQKETDEQIESITNEKRHLKMNFDELLEKMNDSENFEKLREMQKEIDSLNQDKEQLLKQLNTQNTSKGQSQSQPQHTQQNNSAQVFSQAEQVINNKKNNSEELHEINLGENEILKSPIQPKIDNQNPQIPSQTQLDKDLKKGGGFLNALAGIFLTEKDRKMLEQKQ